MYNEGSNSDASSDNGDSKVVIKNNNNSVATLPAADSKRQKVLHISFYNNNFFFQLSVSADKVTVTLVNDLLGHDLPFAQIILQSLAVHLADWSTQRVIIYCLLLLF